MKNINLLSEKYRLDSELNRHIRKTFLSMSVIFLLWILIICALKIGERVLIEEANKNNQKIASQKTSQFAQTDKQAKAIQKDKQLTDRFDVKENMNIDYLSAIADCAKDIHIKNITMDNTLGQIVIEGETNGRENLSSFVKRLSTNSNFKEVTLSNMEQKAENNISFSVTVQK